MYNPSVAPSVGDCGLLLLTDGKNIQWVIDILSLIVQVSCKFLVYVKLETNVEVSVAFLDSSSGE